tara:strand:- start:617 stop:898 length:282 start_codon:yes stop_codon:yes gene_type:complete
MTRHPDGWIEPDDPSKKNSDGNYAFSNPSTDYIKIDPEVDMAVTKRCRICLQLKLLPVWTNRCISCKGKPMPEPQQLLENMQKIYATQQEKMQ